MKNNNTPPQHQEKVAALARQLWEQDGRQTGRDLEYWLKAEQQLAPVQTLAKLAIETPDSTAKVMEQQLASVRTRAQPTATNPRARPNGSSTRAKAAARQ